MRPDVFFTPYGRPASRALADVIVEAKHGSALSPVTVIVPSNFCGLAARRMLGSGLLGVGGVANVNFFTPFRFAELLAVDRLGARRPLTNPVLGAAVRRALADDPHQFGPVRDHQATEQAIAAIVGELSNVSAGGVAAIEADGAHGAGIVALFRSIRSHLTGFHDEAEVARVAAHREDLVQAVEPYGPVIWYLPGPTPAPLAGFVGAVVAAVPSTVIVGISGDPDADREVARTLRIAGVDAGPVATAADRPEPVVGDHIISVTDADEEVRAVVREVVKLLDGGVAPDRIGIFHPVPDPYVRILEQHFAAAGIVANGPSRRRLAESIAGRVLLGALALPGQRWRRDRVLALVGTGPLRDGDAWARPTRWERLSREAAVVGGVADWRVKLANHDRVLERLATAARESGRDRSADWYDKDRADLAALAGFVDRLVGDVSGVETASGWRARSLAALHLLYSLVGPAHLHGGWPESEQAAFDAVEEALERLAELDEIEPDPSLAVFGRALSTELAVARGRNGRFGHGVVYGPLASAPGHDLDAVFLLGCTEGLCPAPRREDAMLPDRIRRLTHGDLPERLAQIDEQHRLFLAALAAAPRGRRWLMMSRGDLRSSRRTRPSRWLLATASALAGRRLYATDFERENPPGVHEIASHTMALLEASRFASADERDLAEVLGYVTGGGAAETHPAAQIVARGLLAQRARAGRDFTEFDGNLAGQPVSTTHELPQSPSRLEAWAACGFRYFLSAVLGIGERDDPERIVELSPLDRGSALHEVLERFMVEMVEAGPPQPDEPWTAEQRARARQIALEVFDDLERRGRTGRTIVWETLENDLLALVDEFLVADDRFRRETGVTPAHLELGFGMGDRGRFPPVTIELDGGTTLRFRGKIDRVDMGTDGAVHVSDYKTGRGGQYDRLDSDDPTMQGRLLQLGLYAEAVRQHLGASRVVTEYWMVNPEVDFKRRGYEWTPEHRDRLVEVLGAMVGGIEAGVFPATPGGWESWRNTHTECMYCEFDPLCVRDRAEHADQKADAPELGVRIALTPRAAREQAT